MALLLLVIWGVVVIVPLMVLLSVAFKSPAELLNNSLGWPQQFVWSNFTDAWTNASLGQALLNSLLMSWKLASDQRGAAQTAYQIQVRDRQGDVWDSEKVASEQSLHIPYRGPALRSRQRYTWQVRV